MLKHALAYARRGWAVFPLRRDSKQPATQHGVHDATTSATQIELWWTREPDCNIGIACGDASRGLLVVDVDGPAAPVALLPPTPTVVTAKGRHYYYRYSGEAKNAVRIKPDMDLRWTGGYVVAPPSVHPSGVEYEWAADPPLARTPLAPAPEWLAVAMRVKAESVRNRVARDNDAEWKPADAARWPEIPDGCRNRKLFEIACAAVAKNATPEQVAQDIEAINKHACRPPLPDREIGLLLRSVGRYR